MTYFIRKIHIAIACLLITSIGHAYEGYGNSLAYIESDNCLSCQPDCCCCGKGFITADLLYWRAFENGLDTCVPRDVSDSVSSDGRVVSTFRGKSRDPHFEWDPGFRIGTGYEFACSDLDVGVLWTHFHSHTHDHISHDTEVRWHIDFDVIDIIAGYESNLSPCWTLRPFAGLRGARIDQKQHIDEFPSSTSSANGLIAIDTKNKEDFSGVGPLVGLEANWNIGCGFSVYASASVSWLYGHFDVRLSEFEEFIDAIDSCKVKKHLNANIAAADAAIGIRWDTCFCMDTRLFLKLGLEHHRYFDYNRIGCYGDLSFDGATFSAGIEF